MNVKQLMELLKSFDENTEVRVDTGYGSQYSITAVEAGKTFTEGFSIVGEGYCGEKNCNVCFRKWLDKTGGKDAPEKVMDTVSINIR